MKTELKPPKNIYCKNIQPFSKLCSLVKTNEEKHVKK